MRKLAAVGIAVAALLTTSTIAHADATSYDVSASTSPTKAGSKKKPVPASLSLTVNAQGTGRPSTSSAFKVTFAGMRANTKGLKTCTVDSINAAQSDSKCNKKAKIGDGYVKNLVGTNTDIVDVSISCNLAVTLYNAGHNRVAVFLKGAPTIMVAGGPCVIPVNQALNGKFTSNRKGLSLSFTIPSNLQHPITGLDQGISAIQVTIDKTVFRSGKKKVGVIESVGGCKKHKRAVTLELPQAAGGVGKSTGSAKCR